MKINPDFILRELAGEYLLVSIAEGQDAKRLLYLNEMGKDIYTHLQEGLEGQVLLDALQEEYEADPDILKQDVTDFLQTLRQYSVLLP